MVGALALALTTTVFAQPNASAAKHQHIHRRAPTRLIGRNCSGATGGLFKQLCALVYSRHCDFGWWWPTTERLCNANPSHVRLAHSFSKHCSNTDRPTCSRQRCAVESNQFNSPNLDHTSGAVFFYDHTNADGSAAVKVTFNIESAQTVGAQKLWPGGGSGFSLNGSNVLMATMGWR